MDVSTSAGEGSRPLAVDQSSNATPLTMTADYYGSMVRTMGAGTTDSGVRFYVPAGGSHNVGGTTQIDALSLLESWVLEGKAPSDAVTAYDKRVTDASLVRTRPACSYPAFPQYKGTGSVDDAANFSCVARPQMLE